MKPLVILGIGGYCANIVEMVGDMNRAAGRELHRPIGFLDDNPARHGQTYAGVPVLGGIDQARDFPDAMFVNGIGSAVTFRDKHRIIARVGAPDERFATLVHPSAYVSATAELGQGTVIAQQSVVMAGARIGRHVKMLPHVTISYGCRVGDHTTVASGTVLLAEVEIGESVYLGANVAVRERCTVGPRTLVAMGANVVKSLPSDATAMGNPARVVEPKKEDGR